VAVRSFLAANQPDKCWRLLDREHEALLRPVIERQAGWWYFFDESFYWGTRRRCLIAFGDPTEALEAAERSLATIPPDNIHENAFRQLFRAEAIIRNGDLREACEVIGRVASLAEVNSSRRIEHRIAELRAGLEPWSDERPVCRLDSRLRSYRRSMSSRGSSQMS
jgi:hypothetical protein